MVQGIAPIEYKLMDQLSDFETRTESDGTHVRLIVGDDDPVAVRAGTVARRLRDLIFEQTLRPGDRLPSSRTLAHDLLCARGTVETAYGELESEGLIERRRGDGTYVARTLGRLQKPARVARVDDRQNLETVLSRRGARIAKGPTCGYPTGGRSFSGGVPDSRAFPWAIWRRLWSETLLKEQESVCGYSNPQGETALREALMRWLHLTRGIKCCADQILILHSTQQALMLCAQLLFDQGDQLAVENPGYPGAYSAFTAAGLRCNPVAVDEVGLDVSQLADQDGHAGVYVTPSYQSPMGGTLSLQRRLDLLAWAEHRDAWIIEDDYSGGLTYDQTPIAALAGLDQRDRTLYIGTCSKLLFPGLRIAWLVLPKPLVAPFVSLRSNLDGHTSALPQHCLARFFDEGHMARHCRKMTALYRTRRDCLIAEIQEINQEFHSPVFKVRPSNAGLKLVVDLLLPVSDKKIAASAKQAGFDLPTLSEACALPGTPSSGAHHNGFILGFSGMNPVEIKRHAQKLRDVVSEFATKRELKPGV